SQPSFTAPSQSSKPVMHAPIAHAPAAQTPVACGGCAQAMPHDPQCFASVSSVASQPSSTSPLQSPNPFTHEATAHCPALQIALAFGIAAQLFPHAPQLARSEPVSVSHPFPSLPSQSTNGALQ